MLRPLCILRHEPATDTHTRIECLIRPVSGSGSDWVFLCAICLDGELPERVSVQGPFPCSLSARFILEQVVDGLLGQGMRIDEGISRWSAHLLQQSTPQPAAPAPVREPLFWYA
ncbi:hypothetical protein [Pseudomonas sp. NW5]|uniref:PA4575 family protein n=1 Tax=Pseudomonas sp. NW5 TaxID=2934934 RepID=UPI0020228F0B|nr:hypothetical protein [Pseudomonas sp. NW5]MCL7461312.1 hypothetical protein [Pseudomonas sp. NW5]